MASVSAQKSLKFPLNFFSEMRKRTKYLFLIDILRVTKAIFSPKIFSPFTLLIRDAKVSIIFEFLQEIIYHQLFKTFTSYPCFSNLRQFVSERLDGGSAFQRLKKYSYLSIKCKNSSLVLVWLI
jgi:hypothetical protein